MGVNSLPKTVTRRRRDCDLNPGPSTPESSTLTTRLPCHPACQLTDQGRDSCGQSNNRPPACSECWSVHWLATSSRLLYMDAVGEDNHVPGRGTHVMNVVECVMFSMLWYIDMNNRVLTS